MYQYSKSSNRHKLNIFTTLLFQNCAQITLTLKAQICTEVSPRCKMELAFLSLLIVAWGNYAFLCNYQFSIAFHCLQIFCCSVVVMVMLLGWLTSFPSKTDKSWNDRVSGKRISGRGSKVGSAAPDINQPTLSRLREGLLPGYFSNLFAGWKIARV